MAGETTITVVGNLTDEATLRYTNNARPVANLTIASTPRTFDRAAGEWRDGEPLFLRCTAWGQLAENTAASLTRGTRVVAHGRLVQRRFTTSEGDNRTVTELDLDDIGPSLRYATATTTRTTRSGGQTAEPTD